MDASSDNWRWVRTERAVDLMEKLTEDGIDPYEFAEAVDLSLGTVLNAGVTEDMWACFWARFQTRQARRPR
jgi:hypothetical protein